MRYNMLKPLYFSLATAFACSLSASNSFAAVTFVSATGAATLTNTIDDNGNSVFIFDGLADGESSELSFSTDSACPGVAMAGGAEMADGWSCAGGVISATVTNRGGMSFGPSPDGNLGTFYVTFSDPPAPPGMDTPPTALSGIQISVFGDVSSWDLTGEPTDTGVSFGIELSGTQGGDAHFRMGLPQAAVAFLGNILGISVGGKPDPFATVTTNEDGSVSISVDIATLKAESSSSSRVGSKANVTNTIVAGARELGVGFEKTSVKTGKSVAIAVCAGTEFTDGDKIAVKFTVGGKSAGIRKSLILNSSGCAQGTVKLRDVKTGTLTAKVRYNEETARTTIKVK